MEQSRPEWYPPDYQWYLIPLPLPRLWVPISGIEMENLWPIIQYKAALLVLPPHLLARCYWNTTLFHEFYVQIVLIFFAIFEWIHELSYNFAKKKVKNRKFAWKKIHSEHLKKAPNFKRKLYLCLDERIHSVPKFENDTCHCPSIGT